MQRFYLDEVLRWSASCVRHEAIKVNSSESGDLNCGREEGVDIAGVCLHHSVETGPGAMELEGLKELSIISSLSWK